MSGAKRDGRMAFGLGKSSKVVPFADDSSDDEHDVKLRESAKKHRGDAGPAAGPASAPHATSGCTSSTPAGLQQHLHAAPAALLSLL